MHCNCKDDPGNFPRPILRLFVLAEEWDQVVKTSRGSMWIVDLVSEVEVINDKHRTLFYESGWAPGRDLVVRNSPVNLRDPQALLQ